jgi:hypothetical protein
MRTIPVWLFLALCCANGQTTPLPSNSVKITDQSASAQTNRPFTISRVFARGEIRNCPQAVINGAAVPTQCDVKTRWPDGTVEHAMLSFHANLAANAAITVEFVNQAQSAAGSPLTQAEMLALPWNAHLDLINGTIPQYTDARAMMEQARWRYWLQGPICTQVIVEDRSAGLPYDVGWDNYRPLHPIFVLTFYPGSPGIKSEIILENDWTGAMEDVRYDVTAKTGPNWTTVYHMPNFTHIAASRWRKVFWNGPPPGAVNIDYNLPYLIHSQVVPNWDLSRVVPTSSIDADVNNFNASDRGDLGGHALWEQYMPGTGGRFDIGVFPVWYVHYLYTFDPRMVPVVAGLAEAGAHVPNHRRESDPNRWFNSAHTVKAFGHPVSLDARPDLSLVFGLTAGNDAIHPVGPTTTGGWTPDLAHQPAFFYIPYLISGDWYFLEELQFIASENLIIGAQQCIFYGRCYTLGWIPYALQTRGVAWGLRDLAEAAFASADGTPEKAYYTEKMDNNIAAEEGFQNITNGSFPPANPACPNFDPYAAPLDRWCYGRIILGESKANPLAFNDHGDPYGGGCGLGAPLVVYGDPYQCSYGGTQAPGYGYRWGVLGHIEELGFPIAPYNRVAFKALLHMVRDPATNPWLSAGYKMPVMLASTGNFIQTWADFLLGFSTDSDCGDGSRVNWRTIDHWSTCNGGSGSDTDTNNPSYPHILRAGTSFLAAWKLDDGNLKGQEAWDWYNTHVCCGDQTGINPQWEYLPRGITSSPPPANTYTISGTITPPAGGAGAMVTLAGTVSATATTNSSGAYSFSGLANGTYTVTPSLAGYTYTPASASITINGASQTANFTAMAAATPPTALPFAPSAVKNMTNFVSWQMESVNGNEIACQMQTMMFPNVMHIFCKQYKANIVLEDVALPAADAKGVELVFRKHAMDQATYRDNLFTVRIAQPAANTVTWDIQANAAHNTGTITCGQNGVGCTRRGKP